MRRVTVSAAITLIVIACIANRRVLASLLSSDGNIEHPILRAAIIATQAILAASGLALLCLRVDDRRLKRIAANLATIGITVLVSAMCLEGVLRAGLIGTPRAPAARYGVPLLDTHPDGSFVLRSRLNLEVPFGRRRISVVSNAYGMRWRDVTVAKPPDRRRIAFVGDSFTFGEWASSLDRTFVGLFDARVGSEYEVLNFGVPSYGLTEIRDLIRTRVLRFEPDFLFLVTFNGNDLCDTVLGRGRYKIVNGTAVWDTLHIARRLWECGEVQPVPSPGRPVGVGLRRIIDSSWAATFVIDRVRLLRQQYGGTHPRSFMVSPSPLSFTYWSRIPSTSLMKASVDSARSILREISTLCAADGVHLAIVAIPFEEQVLALGTTGLGFDTRRPQCFLEELARDEGLPFLDALPALRTYATQHPEAALYCKGDPHLADDGHLAMGLVILSFFSTWSAERATPLDIND